MWKDLGSWTRFICAHIKEYEHQTPCGIIADSKSSAGTARHILETSIISISKSSTLGHMCAQRHVLLWMPVPCCSVNLNKALFLYNLLCTVSSRSLSKQEEWHRECLTPVNFLKYACYLQDDLFMNGCVIFRGYAACVTGTEESVNRHEPVIWSKPVLLYVLWFSTLNLGSTITSLLAFRLWPQPRNDGWNYTA